MDRETCCVEAVLVHVPLTQRDHCYSHCQPHMCVSFPCSVAAVRMADGLTFVIYEFWETEEEWKRLVGTALSLPHGLGVGLW